MTIRPLCSSSANVGAVNTWSNGDGLKGRQLLTWSQMEQMSRRGIEFGAHTETHVVLPKLSTKRIREEVLGSRQTIETRLQTPIRAFAYPYGACDISTERAFQESSFWGACGVEPGLNTPHAPVCASSNRD